MSSMMRKRKTKPSTQTLLDRFFKRVDGIESCKEFCAINIRHGWNFSLPSISYCCWSFSSTISHLLCLLQSATPVACSFNASPCMPAVVLYFSRYCTVRLKMFYLGGLFTFMYYLCEKYYKLITVQYYIIVNCIR